MADRRRKQEEEERRRRRKKKGGKRRSARQQKGGKSSSKYSMRKSKRSGKRGGKKGLRDKSTDKDWFSRPLDQPGALREARTSAELQTGPERRVLMGEIRASQRRSKTEIPSWFKQYQAKISKMKGSSAAAYKEVGAGVERRSKTAGAQDEGVRKNIASEEAASAQNRGMAPEQDVGRTDALAGASAARTNLNDQFAGLIGAQGANWSSHMSDKERIAKGEEISQRLKEVARERAYSGDLRALAREQGFAVADNVSRLRAEEREYDLARKEFRLAKSGQEFEQSLAEREFGAEGKEAKKSRKGQLKLARQYGKNKKKEQRRSLRNQIRVAEKQGDLKKAEQLRSRQSQLDVGRRQERAGRRGDRRSFRHQRSIGRQQGGRTRAEQRRSFERYPPQGGGGGGGGGKKKKRRRNRISW